ncbi:hypothetical protein J3A83DRAFT_4205772 [Scleroderma citrinum]
MAKIALAQLEEFALIDSSLRGVTALLACLELPQFTVVRLGCPCVSVQDPSIFQPFIVDRFHHHPSLLQFPVLLQYLEIHYSALRVGHSKIICGRLNPANTDGTYISLLEEQNLDSLLRFEFTAIRQEACLDGIIAFFHTLPLAHLKTVTIHGHRGMRPYNRCLWVETFRDAPD